MPALLFVVFRAFGFDDGGDLSSFFCCGDSKQIILKTGLLVRQTFNMPLPKIESIDIRQSILGTLLNYGTLTLTGTGGTKMALIIYRRP